MASRHFPRRSGRTVDRCGWVCQGKSTLSFRSREKGERDFKDEQNKSSVPTEAVPRDSREMRVQEHSYLPRGDVYKPGAFHVTTSISSAVFSSTTSCASPNTGIRLITHRKTQSSMLMMASVTQISMKEG